MYFQNCYYSATKRTIISFPHPSNPEVSLYGTAIDELFAEHPDLELIPTATADKLICESFKSVPVEITEDRFNHALESLPPQNWHGIPGGSFFQMVEYITGNITSYYVNYKGKFYTFNDAAWLEGSEVLTKLTEMQS